MTLKGILVTAIVLLLPARSSGQAYFPLKVGNTWGYNDHTYTCEGTSIISSVFGDTNLNGKQYANFKGTSVFSGSFVRADSVRVFEYDSSEQAEFVLFDFSAVAGDTVSRHGTKITIALGAMRFAMSDTDQPYANPTIYTIRDSVGVTSIEHSPCLLELIYAWVDGKQVWPETGVEWSDPGLAQRAFLGQNYPNPFNPVTKISYSLPKASQVRLKVYNVLGEKISSLVDEFKQPGSWSAEFDGSKLPSGIYFYRLVAGEFVEVKKMVLVK